MVDINNAYRYLVPGTWYNFFLRSFVQLPSEAFPTRVGVTVGEIMKSSPLFNSAALHRNVNLTLLYIIPISPRWSATHNKDRFWYFTRADIEGPFRHSYEDQ